MFNNRIELTKLIGLIIMSPCFFLGTLLIQEIMRDIRYDRAIDWEIELVAIAGITILGLIGGVGIALKLRWARILITVVLISVMLLWLGFAVQQVWRNVNERVSMIGFTIFLGIIVVAFNLILYNDKVEEEFGGEKKDPYFDDILDEQV